MPANNGRATTARVHYSRPLTNVSVAFFQSADNFIAQQVFPRVPVQYRSDTYWKWPRDAWNRSDAAKRAPSTESAGTHYGIETDSYTCEVWALHADVSDMERANADPQHNLDATRARLITQQMMIRWEREWHSSFFAPLVWSNEITGVAASPTGNQTLQWDNDSSDPVEFLDEQKELMHTRTGGYSPNTLVLTMPTWRALKNHPLVRDRINFASGDSAAKTVTKQAFASLIEVDRVLVSQAVHNTANEGGTETNAFIGGKHALLCYAAPSPALQEPSAGYTFVWNGIPGGIEGFSTKTFRMEEIESDRIETQAAWGHKLVADEMATFLEDIVS